MPDRKAAATVAAAFAFTFAGSVTAVNAAPSPAPAPALHLPHPFPKGYFEYDAKPGDTLSDTVIVTNVGTAGGALLVYASDGVTSPATGVVYASRQQPFPDGPAGNGEYGAGAWLSLGAAEVRLDPGKDTALPFTVRVPPETHPGDWVGSISAENTVGSRVGGGSVGLNVTDRATIAVVIHIPGPVDTSSVRVGQPYVSVGNQGQLLNIPLEYDGDVLLKPLMHFTITDATGNVLARFDGQYDTFMPHTTFAYAYLLSASRLGPGSYRFDGSFGPGSALQPFSYGFTVGQAQLPTPRPRPSPSTSAADDATPQWLFPVVALAPALLLLLLALLVFARRKCSHCKHRRRRLITVIDLHEVDGCVACRTLARNRKRVRLCGDCYRDHVKAGVIVTAGR